MVGPPSRTSHSNNISFRSKEVTGNLQSYERKQRTAQDFRPGAAPSAAGTGETSAPGGGNPARVFDRALCDLWQPQLQVCTWRAARTGLVFDGDTRSGSHHGRNHRPREARSSTALDRKLPSLQRTTGKNLGNQPRTTATGSGADAGKIMKPLPRGKGLDVTILHL